MGHWSLIVSLNIHQAPPENSLCSGQVLKVLWADVCKNFLGTTTEIIPRPYAIPLGGLDRQINKALCPSIGLPSPAEYLSFSGSLQHLPTCQGLSGGAMKSLILVLCLAHLWGCHSAPPGLGLGYRQPNCDDPETEQAAQVAVDYLNEHLLRGYKHTLNQIDKVKVWPRRPMGEVFEIEIDTLETTCHVLDPTPVGNCSVRQLTEHAVEGDCDFHVLKQNGQFFVLSTKCDSSPDSAEDVRKLCPDCPLLAPLNDTRVVHAVEAALAAFNSRNNGPYYQLVEVSRAQLVPLPASTYVEFAVVATDCDAKAVTDPAKCNLPAEKQYGFCKSTLTEKVGGEDVAVTCAVFQTQPVLPQPPPDNTNVPTPVGASAVPASAPTNLAPAAMVAGPLVVAPPPPQSPVHRTHYDLRHAFTGVASVESASGEAFQVGKLPVVVQPSMAAALPVVRPCPGRVRHFKI